MLRRAPMSGLAKALKWASEFRPKPDLDLWLLVHKDLRSIPRVRAVADFLFETLKKVVQSRDERIPLQGTLSLDVYFSAQSEQVVSSAMPQGGFESELTTNAQPASNCRIQYPILSQNTS